MIFLLCSSDLNLLKKIDGEFMMEYVQLSNKIFKQFIDFEFEDKRVPFDDSYESYMGDDTEIADHNQKMFEIPKFWDVQFQVDEKTICAHK